MDNWLERTELLLGEEKLARLKRAHVLVVGLGGVGAYAAEMVARAGVGRMTIADADTVNTTNINRQLVALHSTVGRQKADVLAERLRDINPGIELTVVNRYIRDEETYRLLDAARYDYVVDAIDTLSPKLALIAAALERRLPLVSSMGAGAKMDPTKLEIADISKTHHCPLAHMLRKRLHKLGIRRGFRAVFSPEPMREGAMILCEEQNKKSNVGTISYIPALFGIGCASVVIRGLIGELDAPTPDSPTGQPAPSGAPEAQEGQIPGPSIEPAPVGPIPDDRTHGATTRTVPASPEAQGPSALRAGETE